MENRKVYLVTSNYDNQFNHIVGVASSKKEARKMLRFEVAEFMDLYNKCNKDNKLVKALKIKDLEPEDDFYCFGSINDKFHISVQIRDIELNMIQ